MSFWNSCGGSYVVHCGMSLKVSYSVVSISYAIMLVTSLSGTYHVLSKAICGWMVRWRLMANDVVLVKGILEVH